MSQPYQKKNKQHTHINNANMNWQMQSWSISTELQSGTALPSTTQNLLVSFCIFTDEKHWNRNDFSRIYRVIRRPKEPPLWNQTAWRGAWWALHSFASLVHLRAFLFLTAPLNHDPTDTSFLATVRTDLGEWEKKCFSFCNKILKLPKGLGYSATRRPCTSSVEKPFLIGSPALLLESTPCLS